MLSLNATGKSTGAVSFVAFLLKLWNWLYSERGKGHFLSSSNKQVESNGFFGLLASIQLNIKISKFYKYDEINQVKILSKLLIILKTHRINTQS